MNHAKNIFYRSLLFFSMMALLLASAHSGSHFFVKESKIKKEVSNNNTSDFILKSVAIEATVCYLHINLNHIFHLIFATEFITELFIPQNILFPNLIDRHKVVLFTRIIQSKAP